jgi:hypothetical protein
MITMLTRTIGLTTLITLAACGGGGGGGGSGSASTQGAGTEDENGFAYLQASYRLPLTHQHEHGDPLFGDAPIATWGENGQAEIVTFDGNGWAHRKLILDFEGWQINGIRQYQDQLWLPESETASSGLYLAYPHKSLDRLAFLSVDTDRSSGTYKLLDFGQVPGTYGRWSAIDTVGGWLLARSFRTAQMGQSAEYSRINVQVVKIDRTGQVQASRTIETANIPSFGHAQAFNSNNNLPFIQLEKHFGDVLISGFASQMQAARGSSLSQINHLWIPIDVASMTLRAPFWIQAERFKQSQLNGQPDLNLYQSSTTGTPTAWQGQGSFVLSTGNANYSSSNLNQGWLRAQLSADYTSMSLTSHGLQTGPTDYNWSFISKGAQQTEAHYRSFNTQEQFTFVGNLSEFKALPVSKVNFSTCSTPGNGAFTFSSNCQQFDRFYALDATNTLRVRTSPAALNVSYVFDPRTYDPTDTTPSVLSLQYPSTQKRLSVDLDTQYRHPGCTTDRVYDAPTFPVLRQPENASLQITQRPAVFTTSALQTSGPLRVSVRPYHYRAPVLCSQYKISLDQRISVARASDSQRTSVQPVLHPHYIRQQISAPTNGSYNAASNVYSPRPGFSGTDTFKVRINDKTGEQDVTIEVRVL